MIFSNNLTIRNQQIIDCIICGNYDPIIWIPIIFENKTIYVSNDVLKINSIRINVSYKLTKQINDILGYKPITSNLSDCIYRQADQVITPCIQKPTSTMASTEAMIRHSKEIDKKINDPTKLISTLGKDWIQTNEDKAINYGWHDKSAPYKYNNLNMWQTPGSKHNENHVDYSQTMRFIYY